MAELTYGKIEELRGLLASASDGPWEQFKGIFGNMHIAGPGKRNIAAMMHGKPEDDLALIVAMRNALPALLDLASHSLASASGGEDAGDPQSIADARQIASEGEYTTDGGRSFAVEFDWVGIAQQGFENWKAKPHNARWFRKIDGTPIPNDLTICIGEAFSARIRSLSSRVEEAGRERKRLKDRVDLLLNDHLVEMREGYDDSIVGFNEAWDIVRSVFEDMESNNAGK